MNKLQVMACRSLGELLSAYVEFKPGVTSEGLWKVAKDWDHKCTAWEFDQGLGTLLGKYRVTNKQWYPIGHVAEPRRKGEDKVDPRQVRMDW